MLARDEIPDLKQADQFTDEKPDQKEEIRLTMDVVEAVYAIVLK